MKYRIKQIVYVPLDNDSDEQREFDEAFSELVRDAFSNIVAPEGFIVGINNTIAQIQKDESDGHG